jgi:hypothetical protein
MLAISAAYTRLAEAFPGLRVTTAAPPTDGGWLRAAELARGGPVLDAFVAGDAHRLSRTHGGRPRPDVAAALALHRYLWPACLLFTVPWFLQRRVPRLPVADVAFHPASGHFTVRAREFACLPGDAEAVRLPGAAPVASQAALRQELRAALAGHVAPVLAGFGPLLRRGPRTLWRMATDEVAEGLWYIGRLLGEEDRAVAELTGLLPGGAHFRTGGESGDAHFRTGGESGDAHFRSGPASGDGPDAPSPILRTRLTCCLFYTVSPTGTCAGCPRTCPTARVRRPRVCDLIAHATISLNSAVLVREFEHAIPPRGSCAITSAHTRALRDDVGRKPSRGPSATEATRGHRT